MQARRGALSALAVAAMLALSLAAPPAVAHVGADAPAGAAAMLRHLVTGGDHLAVLLAAGVVGLLARYLRAARRGRRTRR